MRSAIRWLLVMATFVLMATFAAVMYPGEASAGCITVGVGSIAVSPCGFPCPPGCGH